MKRDLDLVRLILKEIENVPAGETAEISIPGYNRAVVNTHLALLIDAGLVNGKVLEAATGILAVHVFGLTWHGHDFIDASKDDSLWKKAKESILKPTGSMTFDVLLEWLKAESVQRSGCHEGSQTL